MSTFFLLASIVVLTAPRGRERARIVAATTLYVLALASKEEAIAGVLLVLLIFLLARGRPAAPGVGPAAVLSFVVVSGVYFILRQLVMGGFFRENWGLGAHVIRNLGGGFLYQFYPWPVFSLFFPKAASIAQPASPFVPEVLALPLAVILVWIGHALKKPFEMSLAVGWAALALLPVSPFRYRFFSTDSISQYRYYYLSSVGSTLVIAILLRLLWNWNARSRLRRAATVGLFIILCAGYMVRVDRLETKWHVYTQMCKNVVNVVVTESGKFHDVTTLAIENSPLAFNYLGDAIALDRPDYTTVEVKGGRAEAARYAPCLYVSFSKGDWKLLTIVKIKKDS